MIDFALGKNLPDVGESNQNQIAKISSEILSSDLSRIREFFFFEERQESKTLETSMQEIEGFQKKEEHGPEGQKDSLPEIDWNKTPKAKEFLFKDDIFKIESKLKRKPFDDGQRGNLPQLLAQLSLPEPRQTLLSHTGGPIRARESHFWGLLRENSHLSPEIPLGPSSHLYLLPLRNHWSVDQLGSVPLLRRDPGSRAEFPEKRKQHQLRVQIPEAQVHSLLEATSQAG